MSEMKLVVKNKKDMMAIAKAIGKSSTLAKHLYEDKYDLRRSIENAAVQNQYKTW